MLAPIGDQLIIHEKLENKPEQRIRVLVFTKIGQELFGLINAYPNIDYIQLLATKLNIDNGSIKYCSIVEFLDNGQIKHTPPMDVPFTDKRDK